MSPTPDQLADLRRRVTLWRQTTVTVGHVSPDDVLALLDRIDELTRQVRDGAADPFEKDVTT